MGEICISLDCLSAQEDDLAAALLQARLLDALHPLDGV